MKIAIAQLNYHVGNFTSNEEKIVEHIKLAKSLNCDLVVFAELAISGYPPRDFLEFDDFIFHCESAIKRIAKHCNGIAAIVGGPGFNKASKGKALSNTAYFLNNGEIAQKVNKSLLPTYDIFDENRYFEGALEQQCIQLNGQKIALTICEDIWNIEGNSKYRKSPIDELVKERPDFMINIAASPFSFKQEQHRNKVFQHNSNEYQLPLVYVNHVGAQTELIFDGNSRFLNAAGETICKLKSFEEDFQIIDTNQLLAKNNDQTETKYCQIEKALCLGIKDYFTKLGFKKATLGLSGGIDSALALVLAVKALGAENVNPILMPSQFSSDHSIEDAVELCKNLGCEYHTIQIQSLFKEFEVQLAPLFKGLAFDLTEENIQSRIRGTLLMARCNKFGEILLNTSNKSELAVGYGTLYGDMSGGISVIGDLYKTEVFELCHYINKEKEIIPIHILEKAPSAELRPDQKDSDSLPDYDLLDPILKKYLEENRSPSQLIDAGHEADLVKQALRLVNINEYKRHQAPPILRISDKAFGMGRRMPIVGKYLA